MYHFCRMYQCFAGNTTCPGAIPTHSSFFNEDDLETKVSSSIRCNEPPRAPPDDGNIIMIYLNKSSTRIDPYMDAECKPLITLSLLGRLPRLMKVKPIDPIDRIIMLKKDGRTDAR